MGRSRLQIASLGGVAIVMATSACADILGVRSADPRGTGGSSAGGSGAAGEAVGIPAADWTESIAVVLRFDDERDLARTEPPGIPIGSPHPEVAFSGSIKMQGSGALSVPAALGADQAAFASDDPFWAQPLDITFGAWLYKTTTGVVSWSVIGRSDNLSAGYGLRQALGDLQQCEIGGESTHVVAESPTAWPAQTWIHAVCRFKRFDGTRAFRDGEQVDYDNAAQSGMDISGTPFSIAAHPFVGLLDEVFVDTEPLDAGAIRRIWACGIDGARCRCSMGDPREYMNCGLAADCTTLVDCNTPEPPVDE
jgi:hypothetical protein